MGQNFSGGLYIHAMLHTRLLFRPKVVTGTTLDSHHTSLTIRYQPFAIDIPDCCSRDRVPLKRMVPTR